MHYSTLWMKTSPGRVCTCKVITANSGVLSCQAMNFKPTGRAQRKLDGDVIHWAGIACVYYCSSSIRCRITSCSENRQTRMQTTAALHCIYCTSSAKRCFSLALWRNSAAYTQFISFCVKSNVTSCESSIIPSFIQFVRETDKSHSLSRHLVQCLKRLVSEYTFAALFRLFSTEIERHLQPPEYFLGSKWVCSWDFDPEPAERAYNGSQTLYSWIWGGLLCNIQYSTILEIIRLRTCIQWFFEGFFNIVR